LRPRCVARLHGLALTGVSAEVAGEGRRQRWARFLVERAASGGSRLLKDLARPCATGTFAQSGMAGRALEVGLLQGPSR